MRAVYLLASPMHLFPAHYLREPGTSACSAESLLVLSSAVAQCSRLQAPTLAPLVRSGDVSPFPSLMSLPFSSDSLPFVHLFDFLATFFFFFLASVLFSEFCLSPHFLSPLVVNPITSLSEW